MLCPRALGTLEVPQPDRREEKEESKDSKDSKPWLADIRDKAQTEDGHIAQQGMGRVQEEEREVEE